MQKVIVADSVKVPAAELFGQRLKDRRRELGLTQTQLAEQTGSTAAYVSQVERGQANPTLEIMAKLADLVELEVWQMLQTEASSEVE